MSTSASSEAHVFAFAGYRLDRARRRLTGPDGRAVALQPRVFDLLALLVEHPGELLSKQRIMDAVWPDTVVDENNLNQAVSVLRRALGEERGDPRIIATVPRRGYQLIVPVERVAAAGARAAAVRLWGRTWSGRRLGLAVAALALVAAALTLLVLRSRAVTEPSAAPAASIAVLPFRDMSASGEQAYFADGVAEQIRHELAQLAGVRVAGRLSAAAAAREDEDPRAIGRRLGVAHVLAGGVRLEGDRLRVSAQLVSTADGFEIWSLTYDRELDDVFAIQDEIAASVAEALSVRLGAPAPPARYGSGSVQAYDHYLRGRAYFAQSGAQALRAAIDEFRQATEIDPDYGAAWASMARAADFMAVNAPMQAERYRALQQEATRRAREAAPADWETVALDARLLMRTWDWRGAANALEKADRIARPTPVEAAEIQGVFLMQTGRVAEARALFEAARASDPLSFTIAASTAWALDLAGEPEAALREYAHAETLPGDDTDWAYQQLVRLLRQGDAAAIDAYFARYPYQGDGSGALVRRLSEVWRSPQEALALLRAAQHDPDIQGPHRLDALGVLAAHYGDEELALDLFREELFERRGGATVHMWHPAMRDVRRTDGFKDLVRGLGLVDYWRASGDWADMCRPRGARDFECF